MRIRATCSLAALLALLGASLTLHAQSNDMASNAPAEITTNAAPAEPAAATETTAGSTKHDAPAAATEKISNTKPETPPASETKISSGSGKEYSSFRMVTDRNIFNGNRGSGSGVRFTSTRNSTGQRSVQVEWFNLVGTLVSPRGMTAFFDGSSPEFQASLSPGEKFGGFTVKEILHAGVCLLQGTNVIEIAVGSGMRREDQGLWKHSESSMSIASSWSGRSTSEGSSRNSDTGNDSRNRSDSAGRSSRNGNGRGTYSRGGNSEPPPGGSSPTVGNPSSGDVDAVLKRLMEQREKE